MKTQLLKKLTLFIAIAVSFSISAQENFDFTALDCSSNKYTASKATLTCDASGFILANPGTDPFFELRINGVKTDGQNRVVINYTNSSNADGIFFKASGTALQGATVKDLGATSVEYSFDDLNFTDPDGGGGATGGTIQLRSRFVNKAGDPITGNVVITSLVIDDQGTLSLDNVFAKSNTIVTVKDKKIVVKNAPEGSLLKIFNLLGQPVENNRLSTGAYIIRLSVKNAVLTKKIMMF